MRSGYGPRARRSGVTRGKDTAWYREQVSRNVDPSEDTEMRVRFAEREVERLRKAVISCLAQDQRLAGRARATSRAFTAWEGRLVWHLATHHGQDATATCAEGYVSLRLDGEYAGPWKLDDRHEELHGR